RPSAAVGGTCTSFPPAASARDQASSSSCPSWEDVHSTSILIDNPISVKHFLQLGTPSREDRRPRWRRVRLSSGTFCGFRHSPSCAGKFFHAFLPAFTLFAAAGQWTEKAGPWSCLQGPVQCACA